MQPGPGRLHLSAVVLVAPRLTEENVAELVAEAAGKSKREVAQVVARWFPRPDVETSVRRVPVPRRVSRAPVEDAGRGLSLAEPTPVPPPAPAPAPRPEPLSEERFKVTFTGSKSLLEKLEQAKALMSHAVPEADVATVVERALDVLCEQLTKRRFGAAAVVAPDDEPEPAPTEVESLAPGTAPTPAKRRTRYIPAADSARLRTSRGKA